MLQGNVLLLRAADESFEANDTDGKRTVNYVSTTIMVGDEVLHPTGKAGVLAGLTGGELDQVKAGIPQPVHAAFELRPDDRGKTCKPRIVELRSVEQG